MNLGRAENSPASDNRFAGQIGHSNNRAVPDRGWALQPIVKATLSCSLHPTGIGNSGIAKEPALGAVGLCPAGFALDSGHGYRVRKGRKPDIRHAQSDDMF